MPNKEYKTPENITTVCEPAIAYHTKPRTRIIEDFELTANMKSILDERLMEDERLYLSAEDSIKKLNKKYAI